MHIVQNGIEELNIEGEEFENTDVDFADGDGVNEFDDFVKKMNEGVDSLEYAESNSISLKSNVRNSELTTEEKVNSIIGSMTEESDIKFIPKSDGHWDGEKGNSKWIPDDEKVPRKSNPEEKKWADVKKDFGLDGIAFKEGDPDFSLLARGEAHIDDFSDNRDSNFKQADEYEALKRGCQPEEVKEWRKDHGYTWHERKDCETMDKVPSIVHNNIFHAGGISEKKKEISMEGWF